MPDPARPAEEGREPITVLDRAIRLVMTEHLAASIRGARIGKGTAPAMLALTQQSVPVLIDALEHYAKCLKIEPESEVSNGNA